MSRNIDVVQEHDDIMYPHVALFLLIHVGCVAAIWSGVTWQSIAICVVLYWSRMFAIGAGNHRYFSHRAYSTSRIFKFILAFLAQSNAQKSVLWWAAKHRHLWTTSSTVHMSYFSSQSALYWSFQLNGPQQIRSPQDFTMSLTRALQAV